MRNTRNLWLSITFVGLLVVASLVGFATGALKPILGLDLQGGLSVILAAPEGTQKDVMQQALENIRNRVDAFGVGEPQIFVSGNNIEVQLPGLAPGSIEQKPKDQWCLVGSDGTSYGCATDQATGQKALGNVGVISNPKTVCVVDGKGNPLDAKTLCFGSQTEADAAKGSITAQQQAGPTPSGATPTPSGAPSPSASPSGKWCLTDTAGKTYGCFASQKAATAAQTALTTKTTAFTYCLSAPPTVAAASASTSPSAGGKGGKKGSPSPSASPSLQPSAFSQLSLVDGAKPLPCDFQTKPDAQAALAGIAVAHESSVFCVISSAGKNLGCSLDRQGALDRQKETGQAHLLQIIGQTARLEQRRVQAIIPPTDPSFASTQVTCATAAQKQTKACSFDALANKDIVVNNTDASIAPVGKYKLGPVVISGSDITKAQAVFQQATQTNLQQGWTISFTLSKDGSKKFADATTQAVVAPSPTNQIAIVVDGKIISSPQVTGAITNGSGIITGSFTEQQAKDLATQLQSGALPVELTRQSVQTVSATLGEESLKQGIVAGVAGLILLFLYLLFYYRLLGIVAWVGMSIWAILALALVSLAGTAFGYSLTLAGVAGLVISLGVTADSYIVFFERLKDEVRHGKTPRSAVQPAFKRAYRTIVAADLVTGIAAAVLYVTAVSSVKGFALTLGVATLLDLFVVYFFKRPTVFLIARNERLVNMHGFGLVSGVAAEPEPVPIAGGAE